MASLLGYQLSLEDHDFVDTWLRGFAASARTKKQKGYKKRVENEITDIFFGYSWVWGDNESLHHGVSHKPGKPDFWKK